MFTYLVRAYNGVAAFLLDHYKPNPLSWFGATPDGHSVVLGLPPYQQVTTYSCGFVAGMTVLHHFYPGRSAAAFWRKVGATPEAGTDQPQLVRALRRSDVRVGIRDDLDFEGMAAAIDAGSPVIVTVRRPTTDHWVTVGGYGRRPRRIYLLNDSVLRSPNVYTWQEFRRVWAWAGTGLVCSPKRR
jgi:hypothetical protein